MDKKKYMIPTMQVVKLETTQMLASSPVDGFNAELNNTGGDGSDALAPMLGWDGFGIILGN